MKEVKFMLRSPHFSDNLERKNISKFKSSKDKDSHSYHQNISYCNRNLSPEPRSNIKSKHFLRLNGPFESQTVVDSKLELNALNHSFYEEIYKKYANDNMPHKLRLMNDQMPPIIQPHTCKANNFSKENSNVIRTNDTVDPNKQDDVFNKDFTLLIKKKGLSSTCLNTKLIKISSTNLVPQPQPPLQNPLKNKEPLLNSIVKKRKDKGFKPNIVIQESAVNLLSIVANENDELQKVRFI